MAFAESYKGFSMSKKRSIFVRILCMVMLAVLCLSMPYTVFAETAQETASSSESEEEVWAALSGKTAGVMTGTPQDQIILSKVPDAKIQYFNSITDVALALQKKKIDFAGLPTVSYYTLAQQYEGFGYLDAAFAVYDIGTVFAKSEKSEPVRLQLNEYIAELKSSGKLQEMQDYWLTPKEWDTVEIPSTGENGVLTMATTSTLKPFSFKLNGSPVGYEIDIIAGFCKKYGYGLKIEDVDFAGILSGIASGQYDLAASQISWTEERGASVNFSDFYYTQKFVPIVNADEFDLSSLVTAGTTDNSGASGSSSSSSSSSSESKSSIARSIQRTLVDEDRWKSVLEGLGVTLLITVAGFALANIFGAVFCAMSLSKSKFLNALSEIYSKLMQGLPVVVILMILYYVIFGKTKISNIFVAILGFGLIFGAYMAQLFKGGIQSVDKGQWEAALTTGLTKPQTFFGIILPQANRTMLPGYFSNLISLMKGTAVVGYIAINDLTKVGDIIRSNTYEAIVPLLTIAIIYFAIACILLSAMNLIRKRLMPKHKHSMSETENQQGGANA